MSEIRRVGMLISILILSLGLLVACGADNTTNDNFGANNDPFTNEDAGFGDPDADFGNVDATVTVDEGAGLAPTPLAPELTVTEVVTEDLATPTIMPEATETPEVEATAAVTGTEEAMTGTVDLSASYLVRASTLLDLDWADTVDADAAVGDLRDFLFDEEGTIHYTIVDFDGVDGAETVAVSWDQLNVQSLAGVETSANVYGFTWADGVTAPETTAIDVDLLDRDADDIAGLEGVVDATELGLMVDATHLFRASAFVDEGLFDDDFDDLVDANGEDLGDIEDLLIDVNAGMVVYAIVDVDDDILDVDGDVAIPWSRFTYERGTDMDDDDDARLVADVDVTTLESAPVIDVDADFGDDDFRLDDALRTELDTYWDVNINR
jgi:hypothetical protein